MLLHAIAEAHLGERLGDADQGLELAGRGCDGLSVVAHTAHALVLENEYVNHVVWDHWLYEFARIRDILGQECA